METTQEWNQICEFDIFESWCLEHVFFNLLNVDVENTSFSAVPFRHHLCNHFMSRKTDYAGRHLKLSASQHAFQIVMVIVI